MTSKKTGRGTTVVDGETYVTDTFDLDGALYTVRELSVDEGDDIWEQSQEPINPKNLSEGMKTNSRLNTRRLLAKSLIDPAVTIDGVGKWGNRKYATVLRAFNRLNSIDIEDPTPPAGSAGQTQPDGGEQLPTS